MTHRPTAAGPTGARTSERSDVPAHSHTPRIRATAARRRLVGYIRVPYVRIARPHVQYVSIRYVRVGA